MLGANLGFDGIVYVANRLRAEVQPTDNGFAVETGLDKP